MKRLGLKIAHDSRRSIYIFVALLIVLSTFYWRTGHSKATTDTFTTSGTWTVPSGVSSAVYEAWGGGGSGGGTSTNTTGGGGGGGGQYAKKTLTGLVTSDIYTVTVATATSGGTSSGTNGGDSSVTNPSSVTIVLAKGGGGGPAGGAVLSGGAGNLSGSIGDVIYSGGDGGPSTGASATATGGGGGAGSGGAGGSTSSTTAGTGTASNGGNGGAGGTGNYVGAAGSNYGGGGSGASKSNGGGKAGGGGAPGLVTVTYTANSAPNAPTLSTPSSGATGISTTPSFTLSTTDPDSDAVKYRLYLYQSDCATAVGTSPFAQASSGTGWDNGSTAYTSGATATYTYQGTLSAGTTYCWKADAIDPTGSNTYGSASGTQSFTTVANSAPNAPTLSTPSSGATGISVTPNFTLSATDPNSDSLKYRLYLYLSNCSTAVGTSPFEQATTPTGWDNGSTAYTSGATATYTYQGTLSAGTTYCWKADAIDPTGSNTYGSASSTQLFTTASAGNTTVQGGVIIQGGSIVN